MQTIVIGCDNAAVELKNALIEYLEQNGYMVEDVGVADASDDTYYPYVAQRVCERIIESGYEKQGILVCGTGLGMAMTANKFPGIFAGVCHDPFSAERAKLSNGSNVLCLGARVIGGELAKKLAGEWLANNGVAASSLPKVDAMRAIDEMTRNRR